MKFMDQLDRALGLKTVFEAIDTGNLLDREVWMTADPDVLARVAYSKSKKVFWDNLRRIVKELGDQALLKAIDAGDPEMLRSARREARRYANERRVGAQKGSELATRQETPDTMHLSPEQIAAAKQKNAETATTGKPRKQYADEKLWGIFDGNGRQVQGGFGTQAEAEAAIYGDPGKYPEPEAVSTQEYVNEKSLTKLSNIKGPLQNGWTEDEVVRAMMPYIKYHARKYTSNKSEFEDLVQHGAIGVINALRTDKAEAPFGSHAWKHILGEIRRAAMTGGVIKGSDVPGGGGAGQKGGTTGYRILFQKDKASAVEHQDFPSDPSAFQDYFSKTGRHPPRSIDPGFKAATARKDELIQAGYVVGKIQDIRGSMASTDAPMKGGGDGEAATFGSSLKGTKVKTPYQIAMNRDQIDQLMKTSKMSDQQKKVIALTFGLDQKEAGEGGTSWGTTDTRTGGQFGPPESGEAGRAPGTQAGQAPGAAGFDPNQSKQDPSYEGDINDKGKQVGYPIQIVRGPVEVGKMLGISTTKVRQHRAKALHWLQQAAQEREWEHMRKRMERKKLRGTNGPEELGGDPYAHSIRNYSRQHHKPGQVFPAKPEAELDLHPDEPDVRSPQHPRNKPMTREDIEDLEYQSLKEVQNIIRFFIIESIITGDINGTILG